MVVAGLEREPLLFEIEIRKRKDHFSLRYHPEKNRFVDGGTGNCTYLDIFLKSERLGKTVLCGNDVIQEVFVCIGRMLEPFFVKFEIVCQTLPRLKRFEIL